MFYVPDRPDEEQSALKRQPGQAAPTVEDGRTCVAALRAAGAPPAEIFQKLIEMGLDPDTSRALLEQGAATTSRGRKRKRGSERGRGRSDGDEARDSLDDPQVQAVYANALQQAGQRNILIGGIVFVIGVVVTAATLAASSGPEGGRYVIAWGAIVFGAIQFFRGLSQTSQGRQ